MAARHVKQVKRDSVAALNNDSLKFRFSGDTIRVSEHDIYIGDTIMPDLNATWDDGWRPNAGRAVWMAALVPGLGQIYNRSYWKLPIVFGAFVGCIYAIRWNGNMYEDYKQAYRDILTDPVLSDDPSRSYNAILPKGYTIEMMGGRDSYTKTLNSKQNLYRRSRDIAIVCTALVYGLTIIDAFVDAQLFDFDISPDLSLNVAPQMYYDPLYQRGEAGLKLAFTIR